MRVDAAATSYTYDSLNRLTQTTYSDGTVITYTYDAAGNRLTQTVSTQIQNYTISVSASPLAGGTVSGGGTFAAGTSQTVTASFNTGYTFSNWTEGGSVVSTSTSYTFTLSANRTLVANFTSIAGENLTPFQPTGWADKIVVSNVTGTSSDSLTLTSADTLYVDWAVINNGQVATTVTFYTQLYVDDILRNTWFSAPPLNPNFYTYVVDYSIGMLGVGTHTVKIITDSTGVIGEANENDNQYIKTITVVAPASVATPLISPNGGSFRKKVAVRLSCSTSGATIYYTTDGTDPTSSSSVYFAGKKNKGFTLTGIGSHTVKAKAAKSGYNDSSIAPATFTIF